MDIASKTLKKEIFDVIFNAALTQLHDGEEVEVTPVPRTTVFLVKIKIPHSGPRHFQVKVSEMM